KQIILIDLFEGLSYGQQHLKQLRETITHLASIFVYGKTNWLKAKLFDEHKISDLAFVASKVDSAPLSQQENLYHLLEDVTRGARKVLGDQPVKFKHFLLSAIRSAENDTVDDDKAIYFYNDQQQMMKKSFNQPIPSAIQGISDDQSFLILKNYPGPDYLADMQNAQGIDTLLNFMLEES
ncbi:YcjX family protein, partial [Thiomicrospira microaerophila]|uniref:YcjX family protein n=1 Tax=Thiomicrospira microaerophila TaxID=406020 RepID=UPI0005CA9A8A